MKIPEIERALADSDPKVRLYICKLQEQILTLTNQQDETAKILIMIVQTLENVQRVNLQLADRWENKVTDSLRNDDIVQSVIPDPED